MKPIKYYISKVIHNPQKVVWKLDKIFLGGKLRSRHQAKKEKKRLEMERFKNEHPEEWYDIQTANALNENPILGLNSIAVKDILLAQFNNGEAVYYDIAIKILAIEQYYGKNNIGYDLYSRMQEKAGNGSFWLQRFIKLIELYEKSGIDTNNSIDVDINFNLLDGAHRLALSIYHHKEEILTTIHKNVYPRRWSYAYIAELNFSQEELVIIRNKVKNLFVDCRYPYVGVIWPSAFHLRDDITSDIESLFKIDYPIQNSEYKVIKYIDKTFDYLDFVGFFRGMYYADAMDDEGISRKLKYISNCLPEDNKEYNVRILYVDVNNQDIILNEKNNSARSNSIATLKKVIRSRFANKISHYEYDNILHVTDNYLQSRLCEAVINIDKNISEVFENINKKFEYAIVKFDGRQDEKFPLSYYYYTDLDVLVKQQDVRQIGDYLEKLLKEKFLRDNDGITIKRRKDDIDQVGIMVLVYNWRCFMIHIQTISHFQINEQFSSECIANRQYNYNELTYILPAQYEILVRASELIKNDRKSWHRQYIKDHINDFDEQLLKKAFNNNLEYLQKIRTLVNNIIDEK